MPAGAKITYGLAMAAVIAGFAHAAEPPPFVVRNTEYCLSTSPVVADDGRVYATAGPTCGVYDGTGVIALDTFSGDALWGPALPPTCHGQRNYGPVAAGANGLLYITSDWLECGTDARVTAFDPLDGAVIWHRTCHRRVDHPKHSPSIDDEHDQLYFGSGRFCSKEMSDGSEVWFWDQGFTSGGHSPTLIDSQGAVYFSDWNGTDEDGTVLVRSFPPDGSEERWLQEFVGSRNGPRLQAITADDHILAYSPHDDELLALSREDGSEVWPVRPAGLSRAVIDAAGNIYAGGEQSGAVVSLDADGDERWTVMLPSPPAKVDLVDNQGQLFVRSADKVYALSTTDGSEIWTYSAGAELTVAAALIPGGSLLLADDQSRIHVLATQTEYASSVWPKALQANRRHTSKANQILQMPPADSAFDIAALGDSYSSGHGARPYDPATDRASNRCLRSLIAWTSDSPGGDDTTKLPGFGDYPLRSVACSGAVISDLTTDNHEGWAGEGPQVERLGSPEMITLTIGGNDAFFELILKACIKVNSVQCENWTSWGEGAGTFGEIISDRIDALRGGELRSAFEAVKTAAPDATVFVAGYPRVVPEQILEPSPTCAALAFGLFGDTEWMRGVADALNSAIECSAQEAGVHFVGVADRFDGEEACALEPLDWISPLNFHPNSRGQKEYARQLNSFIAEDFDRLLGNPDPVPGACGAALSVAGGPLPSLGDLEVVGEFAPECGESQGGFAPNQAATLLGGGFAVSAPIELEIHYDTGGAEPLGGATSDATGILDHETTIPAGAPTTGTAMLLARGEGADAAPRLLLGTVRLAASTTSDTDEDTIPDNCDNCPDDPNTTQLDTDGDGAGDACDVCPADSENDLDEDGQCDNLDGCVDVEELELSDEIVVVSRTESACSKIMATRYEITSFGDVLFVAGSSIELGDGFVVEAGGRFTASIGTP